MSALEDRLRAALVTHAQESPVDPDAWEQTVARSRRRLTARLGRLPWPARFVIPAAVAAAVTGIIIASAVTMSSLTGRPGGPAGASGNGATDSSAAARPTPSSLATGIPGRSEPPDLMLTEVPASSAVLTLQPPIAVQKVSTYFWFGYNSPSYWTPQINAGLQFCHWFQNENGGSGFCGALPQLGAGQVATVRASEKVVNDQEILLGAAAVQVTSVTALLPDGRTFRGVVGTARGFPDKAWAVGYPAETGVHVVFRDASGRQVAVLGTTAPVGPGQATQPGTAGVQVFHFPGGGKSGTYSGAMVAYLVDGRVGFWSNTWGGLISPVAANGKPTLGGLMLPFGLTGGRSLDYGLLEAFGYAHADVARVTLRLPDGTRLSTSTFAADWPGSDLRLWTVSVPKRLWHQGTRMPTLTATAYDTAGHVIGQVQLGSQR